jgi:hypothetical protein
MNIDLLISKNSEGKIDNLTRWNLKKTIENAASTEYACALCEQQQPKMPSKRIENSQYCRQHLLYALVVGKDITRLI